MPHHCNMSPANKKRFAQIVFFLVVLIHSGGRGVLGQEPARMDQAKTVTVIPGKQYKAGWLHELFFGAHWRDAWTLPLEVKVLDLEAFAGGLTPIGRGGGFQTKALRFQGKDGKQYKFRSLDKDPSNVLPEDLRESVVADVVQDQISSSNPFAQLVAVPIMNAVGILNSEPQLVVLPHDERLGEFRGEFGGVLGTIEEHPDDPGDGQRGFAGADKVVNTVSLLEKVTKDYSQRVDEVEYLKARLIDIYLGDWDRHIDQWRWAGFQQPVGWLWKPIPRDRDQAFSRFDGILPWVAERAVPQLTHFDEGYPQINDLTWSGRYLDRRFLSSLPWSAWDSMTTFIQERITPDLITVAVRKMPSQVQAREGANLEYCLQMRREGLPSAAREFYELVTKYQDIHASDGSEEARVTRLDNDKVLVEISGRAPASTEHREPPFYSRVFNTHDTKEIRLLLHGGDDRAIVTGFVDCSPDIYIDGGEGKDELVDSSSVRGWFLGVIPFAHVTKTKTFLYDSGKKTTFVGDDGTSVNTDERRPPATEAEKWEPPVRDYGHDWKFGPWFGVSPDEGIFLGGGPILYEFGFRKEPYVYRMSLRLGYATGLNRFRLDYTGEFFSCVQGMRLSLHARASGIDVIHHHGLGNETGNARPSDFYKVLQRHLILESDLEVPLNRVTSLSIGMSVKNARTDLQANTLLDQTRPYGVGDISLADLHGQIVIDDRDNALFPSEGAYARAWGSFVPSALNNEHTFGRAGIDTRLYLMMGPLFDAVIASRLAAEKLFGTYPFFEAATLGGSPLLRGFDSQRFTGDAMVVTNGELRLPVVKYNLLVPTTLGLLAFVETGRIFLAGEKSRRWHTSAGGGIWFSFVRKDATLSLSIARSEELTGIYATGGFKF